MFIRTMEDVEATNRVIVLESLKTRSARFLTVDDGMGFSYHLNRCDADSAAHLWYKHHWESNHILSGTGRVEDLSTGESWELAPGMLYNVGPKDRHRVTAKTDIHLLSVFSPPLRGDEQHDADGALEPSGPVPPGPPGY